ncbi:MAG: hypothetical protein KA035_02795 [Candidatus Levybacteria bacterium]|nr:hypothetical protein [Candidatus Levybacteria bacterium]
MPENHTKHIPHWEKVLAFVLEAIIFATAILQIVFNNWTVGALTLVALAAILFPKFLTRRIVVHIPLEVEILLFLMVILQLVVGESLGFYAHIPYYDKIVHYMLPFFVGVVSFLIYYTMYQTGRIKTSTTAAIFMIILITLGVGALWEIIEYFSDIFVYPYIPNWHHFQGNLVEDPWRDTMNDLVTDFLGGIFGSILCLWFLEKSRFKKGKRIHELTNEMEHGLFNKKEA